MISTHGAVMDSSFLFRIGSDMVVEKMRWGIRILAVWKTWVEKKGERDFRRLRLEYRRDNFGRGGYKGEQGECRLCFMGFAVTVMCAEVPAVS